jgi:hypothetical protein
MKVRDRIAQLRRLQARAEEEIAALHRRYPPGTMPAATRERHGELAELAGRCRARIARLEEAR